MMARQRASACLSVALWVWCASVCVAEAKDKYIPPPEGPSATRPPPASPSSRLGANDNDTSTSSPPPPVTSKHKPPLTTVEGVDRRHEEKTEAQNTSGSETQEREAASKRNSVLSGLAIVSRGASSSSPTAEHLRSATSLAGNLALLLISVIIAGALFVMVVCFIHKWRENMGTGRYPRVVYSMLRQSEDEPEDVLGEILINIGLAAPGDSRPLTPSSSSSSSRSSPAPAEPMNINDIEGSKFTTIPLRSDEAAKRLMAPEPEESDEELLQ